MKKIDLFKNYIHGKDVLDLGCIQHSWKEYKSPTWLHRQLKKYSKSVTGVDYLKKDVKILNKKSYNIIYGNVENFDLKRKFDVLIAGDLIEHLSNFGNFLECCKKHMKKDSHLLITTPNAFSIDTMLIRPLYILLGKYGVNSEHTCWFDYITLSQLAKRHGFIVEDYYTFLHDTPILSRLDKLLPKNFKTAIFMDLQKK